MKNLTRDEMKKTLGGLLDVGKCTTDSDCGKSVVVCGDISTTVQNKCNGGVCVHAGCPS